MLRVVNPMTQPPPSFSANVLGVRVDDIAIPELLARIQAAIASGTRLCVVNANVHLINLAQQRPWLPALFRRADIAFCDGAGVQFAVWALTGRKPHRHTPPQWAPDLARRLAADNRSVFWLGGRPEVIAAAASRFTAQTGLRAAGFHHGYFDRTPGSAENDAVIAAINAARPDLLLLGMGMPVQEEWLDQNWSRINATVAITSGALVDHAAGLVARPPLWVADLGLEWLVRLVVEPRRLWRRYLIGLPQFAWRLAPQLLRGRTKPGIPPQRSQAEASLPPAPALISTER
jgi:N-acetylglucosaminyldiphosphoundecaprenol N-acetyl-beta-D-mannosaminyltransferase